MEAHRDSIIDRLMNMHIPSDQVFINWMAYVMIIVAVVVLAVLQFLSAPYGRYSSSKWGPLINAKVAWFLQEIPALIIPIVFLFHYPQSATINKLLLTCFIIHYIHRAAIFPFLINGGKPTPFIPFFLALIFCGYNGYMQAYQLLLITSYPSTWLMSPSRVAGLGMFFGGMFINIHSDHILRTLRKPGETGYKIPSGGAFNFVSGGNFFGEIVEWCGFAVATQTLPSLAFAIFTACNLIPRAVSHHRWYLQKFEDYPKKRKAVIPFLL